ncbi:MAG: hypothetical protein ACRD0P_06805, partial [Stackebrandtia sp.]
LSYRPDLEYEARLRAHTTSRDLAALTALLDGDGLFELPTETADSGDDFMVDFGLDRILDGVQTLIDGRR